MSQLYTNILPSGIRSSLRNFLFIHESKFELYPTDGRDFKLQKFILLIDHQHFWVEIKNLLILLTNLLYFDLGQVIEKLF